MYEQYLRNNSSNEEDLRFKFRAVVMCYLYYTSTNEEHSFPILLNNKDVSSSGYVGVTTKELVKSVKNQLKHLSPEEIELIITNFRENSYSVSEEYISIPFEFIVQSTGLHSKSGDLVYEGDIVQSINTGKCYCVVYSLENGCFYLEDMKFPNEVYSFEEFKSISTGVEIIGNVFQSIGKVR